MAKKPVVVLGGGGHAKVLVDALRLQGREIRGYTDLCRTALPNVKYLGNDDVVFKKLAYSPKKIELVNGVGSTQRMKENPARRDIYKRFKEKRYVFCTVKHPSAVVAKDVILGEGAQIMAGAVIQTGTKIGENTIINSRASVDHDCRIGSHVHVAPGAVLSGGVSVGDGSHLGTGCVVTQGVRIEEDCALNANERETHGLEKGHVGQYKYGELIG